MEKQASDTLERLFQYPTRLTSWPEYFIIHTQSNQDHPDSIYITLPALVADGVHTRSQVDGQVCSSRESIGEQ